MEPDPIAAVAGLASLITGFLVYQNSGVYMTFLAASMIFATVFLVVKAGIMKSMAALTNPFIMFFTVFPLAFAYLAIQGDAIWVVTVKSLGAGLLAGAASMTVFNYWNIGG